MVGAAAFTVTVVVTFTVATLLANVTTVNPDAALFVFVISQ
jgi:hypothetical protein